MFWINKLLFLGTIVTCCNAYKILFITQIPTGSHYILSSKLAKELGKRGHEVTFITPYTAKSPMENVKEVHIDGLDQVFAATRLRPRPKPSASPFEKGRDIMSTHFDFTQHLISHEKVQKLLRSNEKYDLVILYQYFNDALLSIAHHFKAPLILFSSMPLYVPESFLLSHPNPSSYVPNILTEYTGRMNFWQRLKNSFSDVCMILYYQWVMLPKQRELVEKYIPGKPELYDILNNGSILFINSHVSTNEAIPLVPNAIEVGGFHIEEPKPLPDDLQKYIDNSKNGVILFSMGSIFKSANFPQQKREALLNTFAKLKENILWKFEDENFPDLPKNVKIMKWIPQADILAHPKVKAFISHGGLLSTMESVYHAVPIVGIPHFVDQHMNIAYVTEHEFGVHVPFEQLTEERLTAAIKEVIANPKYKENIKKRSNILRDRPMHPMDIILYWTEYVVRHEGARHLRYPGMDLNWFQRNLLDIFAFVVLILTVAIFISCKFFKTVSKPFVKSKKNKKD